MPLYALHYAGRRCWGGRVYSERGARMSHGILDDGRLWLSTLVYYTTHSDIGDLSWCRDGGRVRRSGGDVAQLPSDGPAARGPADGRDAQRGGQRRGATGRRPDAQRRRTASAPAGVGHRTQTGVQDDLHPRDGRSRRQRARAGGHQHQHRERRTHRYVYTLLYISARCIYYISRLCYDVSVRLSVRLSVTEVHWRIIANLGFKFRSHFTAHYGRRCCLRADHLALC